MSPPPVSGSAPHSSSLLRWGPLQQGAGGPSGQHQLGGFGAVACPLRALAGRPGGAGEPHPVRHHLPRQRGDVGSGQDGRAVGQVRRRTAAWRFGGQNGELPRRTSNECVSLEGAIRSESPETVRRTVKVSSNHLLLLDAFTVFVWGFFLRFVCNIWQFKGR